MATNPPREPEKKSPPYPPSTRIWPFLLGLVLLWVLSRAFLSFDESTLVSYTRFREELDVGNVRSIVVSGEEIRGSFEEAIEVQRDGETLQVSDFKTYYPRFEDVELLSTLRSHDVEVVVEPSEDLSWWTILAVLAPFLLIAGIFFYMSRQIQTQGRGLFSMGKSRAKLYDRSRENTTFDDVAGTEGAKGELTEIVDFLKNPSGVQSLGAHMPKGVLLVGPPGTGKTLLARAVAGEAGVPFLSITGSDFMEMFVGVGASRVRDLFTDAKKSAPSIIFIDELDSIGRRRGAGVGGGHDEREQTLNQLLSEMDGFEPNEGVIVMAATNRPDILDPALLRPGRFDRQVRVELPTTRSRIEILNVHARSKPLGDDVDLEEIARGTPGFSGADLANLLNEAALFAARSKKQTIGADDVEKARDKIVMGLKRESLALTREECEMLAYHEAGHAIVAAVLPHADPVRKVTVVPRGKSMGHTEQLPKRERYIYDRNYLLDRLAVMMGGRVAEEAFRDTATTGSEEDLKQATSLARKMVLDWGMGKMLSKIAPGSEGEEVFLGQEIGHRRRYSEKLAQEVDDEVRVLLDEAYQRAHEALLAHEAALRRLVALLVDREEIPGKEVLELIEAAASEAAPPEEVEEASVSQSERPR